jgi:TIR domain-containing protein
MGEFEYDVFISYKRDDFAWAKRLDAALTAANFRTFLDVKDLRSGADWATQLEEVVSKSRHQVLIWSSRAEHRIGDIISKELHYFSSANKEWGSTRQMVIVALDDEPLPPSYRSTHAHKLNEVAGKTAVKPEDVGADQWRALMDLVVRDLREGEQKTPVNLLVVTTSAEWWGKMENLTSARPYAKTAAELLTSLQLDAQADVTLRYAKDRMDWRPFGSKGPTLRKIVKDLEDEINQWAAQQKQKGYAFREVSNAIWSDDLNQADPVINKLAQELSLIIVDPLSLHDLAIRELASRLGPCFDSPRCAVVTLGPSGWTEDSPRTIREQLRGLSREIYTRLYSPPFPPMLGAHAATHAGDLDAIKRLLLLAIGAASGKAKRSPAILQNRGR